MAGIAIFDMCKQCGEAIHNQPPPYFWPRWVHLREYSPWKGPHPVEGMAYFKAYDHRAGPEEKR